MKSRLVCLFVALGVAAAAATAAEPVRFTIRNPLNLGWPWDLTHHDFPAGTFQQGTSYVVTVADVTRPAQLERAMRDGKAVDRLWFVATLPGGKEAPESFEATVSPGSAPSPLTLKAEGHRLVVDNRPFSMALRSFKASGEPVPLRDVPHWFGGVRFGDGPGFVGTAWFDGDATVEAVEVKPLVTGLVFCDIEVRIRFADPGADGQTQALPMVPGKQTHTYAPNEIPTEPVVREQRHYRAVLRFVMGDPWVEVVERYHLPGAGTKDAHGYTLNFGPGGRIQADAPMAVDTTMRVRWFEYDAFGGNTNLIVEPSVERDIQKGRPFAILQPRWTQRGGGAQEMILTSGGSEPASDEVPAVGVVATFASKWVGPYQSFINAYADKGERGHRGWYEAPLGDGQGGGRHYGQRSYAIVAGPRKLFDSTGAINQLVRRHTDWTLAAQMNRYILQWDRDEAKGGPHILMSPQKLRQVRDDWAAGRDTPAIEALRRTKRQLDAASAEVKALKADIAELQARLKAKDLSDAQKAELQATLKGLQSGVKQREKVLGSDDARLLAFITEGSSRGGGFPSGLLWVGRRYQDDFLNPTTYTRNMHGWGWPDLYAGGKPSGGAAQAATAYIFADLDHWPGWHNGWNPGNPNFHTDKYMVTLYAGASMLDHPHARDWLEFGVRNFRDDLSRVLLAPDGVGWECPGYSGYSFGLQLKVAKVIANTGYGNPIASNPLTKATGIWHRKLITPPDARLGLRHEAPHGDTHRWTSGMGFGFAKLAAYYAKDDPAFAREMMGTWQLLIDSGMGGGDWQPDLSEALFDVDTSVQPLPAEAMDWASQAFYGFGTIMRNGFGTPAESFVSLKAGPARGHYHNDELAYHFYSGRTPVSLDYNCSYHPRADHACLHNSMTFGREGTVLHNKRNEQVKAHEQLHGTARVGAFVSTEAADVVVAERTNDALSMGPIDPHDHEFSRGYPSRRIGQTTHRRTLALIKHAPGSRIGDYLVVLDQTDSAEPQQLNVHVLARDAKVDGQAVTLEGQLDKDIGLHLIAAVEPTIGVRSYHYLADERNPGPALYAARPGETVAAWHARLKAMMAEAKAGSLPIAGLDAADGKDAKAWHEQVEKTHGLALAVPPGWSGRWLAGEYQVWLRIETKPGTPTLWLLHAWPKDGPRPTVEPVDGGRGVRVSLGGESETVSLGGTPEAPGMLRVTRGGRATDLLDLSRLPPLGQIEQKPLKP